MQIEVDRDVLAARVRDIPDFPTPGVMFRDVTPLLLDHAAFSTAIDALVAHHAEHRVDKVVGIEARGFILAAPVAYRFGAGFVPARKLGKLPGETAAITYDLEYGQETLEVHRDAIAPGDRVLVIDDVLATGGTAAATADLVEELGGTIVGFAFLIELLALGGAGRLGGRSHAALLRY